MKVQKLANMYGGWFIGDFNPTLYSTQNVEIAVKKYISGQYEKLHFHKIATEFTVIITGTVKILDNFYNEGDILIIEPNEAIDFLAITEVTTVVVKLPGAINDKYII